MYFDLSPRSRAPRHRPQSPRSASATSTTTLLPFRRSGHAVDVALAPVQEYTQPQWSLPHSPEPLWSPHRVPPPPTPSSAAATSPVRESFVQQQQQQRTGAWAGTPPPHAYCVGGYVDPSDGLRPPARSPRGESEALLYYTAPSSHNGGETAAAALPRQPFAASPIEGTAAAAANVTASSTPQRRDAVLSGDRRRQLNGGAAAAPSPVSRPRGRGITEVRPGCTTSTERVRYRNNVTKKLIDLYDEVAELYECRDNMNFQVTQAMRSDPRYTKERHGEVRLAYKPTPAQQAAMTGVDTALEALHDACHELVACYLTPEEKRYLGIDTHLFQTHAERSTTYQYAPPSAKDKVKKTLQPPAPPGGAGAASSRASSTTSSTRRHHRSRESGEVAQQPQQQPQTPMRDDRFTSQATSLPSAATPPPPMPPPVLSPSPSPIAEERTASTVRMPSPSPPLAAAAAAPLAFSPPVRQAFAASPAPEDTAAEGSASSPERLYARAASTSSLGGGGWPSDTASATVRAASAVAAPQSPVMTKTAVAAPGGATMRGPQGQLLVKVPVQPPHSPTLKLPPGIPPGAKLVKMPMSVSPTSAAPSGAFPPPPAAAALPSSNPPSRPPSRTNSAINRTTASAPKAPATRAEFMKFLIDSDSDSTA